VNTPTESKTTKTFVAKIPVVYGMERNANVTIQRNQKTSSVQWTIGDLDSLNCTSCAMQDRLNAAGMIEAIKQWRLRNKALFTKRETFYPNNRWGYFKYLPHDLADELAAIILEYYEAAVIDLPTDQKSLDQSWYC
jgi:hypothetical protein